MAKMTIEQLLSVLSLCNETSNRQKIFIFFYSMNGMK